MSRQRLDFEDVAGMIGALIQASVMLIGASALAWGLIAWLFR